ncbi:SLC13 family permease [uncultured Methylobacterium sp.]|uniref:SLC13 family permease n=1 Tax=uncultured Methylobacterium sp. TaxID=157278 RepID=UPI0035CC9563
MAVTAHHAPPVVAAAPPDPDHATIKLVGVGAAVLVAAAIWLAPTPAGLSLPGHKALALFGCIFILYLTEAIPLAVASLLVVPAATLSGITTVKGALEGFSAASAYLIVGAFVLATAMVKTRLAERITYRILLRIGSAPTRITLGVTLVNIALAFLVPSSTARTAILLPECLSILALYGTAGRSPFAINLLLTLTMTNATIGAGILTATVPNPVTVEFVAKAGGHTISYAEWLLYGFPPALLMTFATWGLIQRVFPPEVDARQAETDETIRANLDELGGMSSPEWRTLLVFGMVTLLWATQGLTGFDTTVVCLAGVVLLFLPKFGVMSWADANKGVSWQVLLVAGGGISLGDILLKTGAAGWLADAIFHGLGLAGASTLVVVVVVMLIVQYLHLIFVGTTAMATALLPIILAMADTANISPVALALPAGMIIGGYPLLMFYNTLPSIIVYGTGRLTVGDFPKVGVAICALACLVYALCAATYWRWLGLY